ncbi:hypothetical protein CPB84DRAFT_1958911 [Gymnopilus junonius]|uniref:RanBP2-type domain-containing protein n=1 Tax=Gymnopilus junonius TaxID=109634 RepID=A0A9P5NX04_GYMJU|nr:hypothetical protein CPB84DRAFT_1958911 [Gymnopilus junonius]
MSAIRNSSNRSAARKTRSSPYSFVTKIVRYWWPGEANQDAEPSPPPTQLGEPNLTSASSERPDLTGHTVPQFEPTSGPPHGSIHKHRSQDSQLLNKVSPESSESGHAQESAQFTFQFTAPGVEPVSLSLADANAQPSTPTPQKKLARNPNGSYRWEGAGSAKHPRTRNRYASPALVVTPTKSERLLIRDNTNAGRNHLSDGKRRKVDEESLASSESSKNASYVPFPHTSPTMPRTNGSNGASGKPNALSSTSRLRTPAKPTAPVVPSPLRHAWPDASSTSSGEGSRASPPQTTKQTQTASFMAGLIKETTPPKKPDLSNPYQVSSPVGKIGPPRRGTKRPRATGKPPAPSKDQTTEEKTFKADEKEKIKEYSPQAIIEATLPKGSKRSRPPPHLEKRNPSEDTSRSPPAQREPPVVVETRKVTYVVEEPEEDEDESRRAMKKTKPSANGHEPLSLAWPKTSISSPSADIVVEEVDVDMMSPNEAEKEKIKETAKLTTQVNGNVPGSHVSATSPTSRPSFNGLKSSSIPKEPSKLRFSFQAETSASPLPSSSPLPTTSAAPVPPLPKSDFKFTPPVTGFDFTFKSDAKETEKTEKSDIEAIKQTVRATPTSSLPIFAFGATVTSTLPSTADQLKLQNDVKALPKLSLPTFDFGSSKSASFSFDYDPSKPKTPGSYSGSYKASPPKVSKPTAVRRISSSSPVPSAPAPAPAKAFDFAAAGLKAPVVAKDSKICSACGLSSPASASQCIVCDEPLPGSAPAITPTPVSTAAPPAPPAAGFNWAAAGMKPPSATKGTWKCSECGLDTPEAKIECTVCGAPKP